MIIEIGKEYRVKAADAARVAAVAAHDAARDAAYVAAAALAKK
jgi:hypothetical protein